MYILSKLYLREHKAIFIHSINRSIFVFLLHFQLLINKKDSYIVLSILTRSMAINDNSNIMTTYIYNISRKRIVFIGDVSGAIKVAVHVLLHGRSMDIRWSINCHIKLFTLINLYALHKIFLI